MVAGEHRDRSDAGGAQNVDRPIPLLVTAEGGAVVDVALMNRKGFNKSRENGVLWSVHEATGRLLPYAGNTQYLRLIDCGRWYQAVVSADVAVDLAEGRGADSEGNAPTGDEPEAAGADVERGEARGEVVAGGARTDEAGGAADQGASKADVIHALAAVIGARKRDLPEGSYTTYLFKAGVDKIRKKTGEEVVELLLARKREEVILESADLLYHLLVLLAELDVGVDEVLGELAARAK